MPENNGGSVFGMHSTSEREIHVMRFPERVGHGTAHAPGTVLRRETDRGTVLRVDYQFVAIPAGRKERGIVVLRHTIENVLEVEPHFIRAVQ